MKIFQRKNYKFLLLVFLVAISGVVFAATASELRSNLITLAKGQLGNPYRWGVSSPNGSDCSGLMNYCYKTTGIASDQLYAWGGAHGLTAAGQFQICDKIETSALLPGDFLFEANTGGREGITHVGMYIGNNRAIEAAWTKKVKRVIETSLKRWTNSANFAGAGRINSQHWPNGDNGGNPDDIIIGPIIPPLNPYCSFPYNPLSPACINPYNPSSPSNPPTTGEHSFGGYVSDVYSCKCVGNHLITINNLVSGGPNPIRLIYQPGASVVYENNKMPQKGVWLNGLWKSRGDICADVYESVDGEGNTISYCGSPYDSNGTITFTGTSD